MGQTEHGRITVPMQNITFDGYHLPTLAKLARELGSPTNDALAEFFWTTSNRATLPQPIASEWMREAGYVPFVGFPLKRSNEHATR
jgi:hypothetical protein